MSKLTLPEFTTSTEQKEMITENELSVLVEYTCPHCNCRMTVGLVVPVGVPHNNFDYGILRMLMDGHPMEKVNLNFYLHCMACDNEIATPYEAGELQIKIRELKDD
jgi:hypothetical protein